MLGDMKRYGELDVSSCFSCGTCTEICPLVDNNATFPRSIIRLAQVGLKDYRPVALFFYSLSGREVTRDA